MRTSSLFLAVTLGSTLAGCAGPQDADDDMEARQELRVAAPVTPGTTTVNLVAIGTLSGLLHDKSNATSGALEDGTAGNLLGGIGSGLAYAGSSTYVAVPDRGPNATSYNDAIDNTTSYINRFQTLKLKLKKNTSGTGLPLTLNPVLKDTTLLYDSQSLTYGTGAGLGVGSGVPALNNKKHFYFTGRSDNFAPGLASTTSTNARFDPESVRVSKDGSHVYISDEYGPYIYEFARDTGRRTRSFALPPAFAVANPAPVEEDEIAANTTGRVTNKGLEGLAITPDGKTLIAVFQSPLLQDGATKGRFARLVRIGISSGAVTQFAYELTNIGTAAKPKYTTISDLVAVNATELLVDERDSKGLGDDSTAVFKRVFHTDIAGAVDVSAVSGEANLVGKAVPKDQFLDIVAALNAYGIASNDIPAKLEGLAIGPDVKIVGKRVHTLFISNDNDFNGTVTDENHPDGIDNPNKFFVFSFGDSNLPGLGAQSLSDPDDTSDE